MKSKILFKMRRRHLNNRSEEKSGGLSPFASLMRSLDKRAPKGNPRRDDRDSKCTDDDENVTNLEVVRSNFTTRTANAASICRTVFNAEEMIDDTKLG